MVEKSIGRDRDFGGEFVSGPGFDLGLQGFSQRGLLLAARQVGLCAGLRLEHRQGATVSERHQALGVQQGQTIERRLRIIMLVAFYDLARDLVCSMRNFSKSFATLLLMVSEPLSE